MIVGTQDEFADGLVVGMKVGSTDGSDEGSVEGLAAVSDTEGAVDDVLEGD